MINPWMSMWMSAWNRAANTARGHAMAQTTRTYQAMTNEVMRRWADACLPALPSAKPARRRKRSKR